MNIGAVQTLNWLGRMMVLALLAGFAIPQMLQIAGLVQGGVAQAQEERRQVPPMSERAYQMLSNIQEALDEENYQEALRLGERALGTRGLNANERAQINNMMAFTHFNQENYRRAMQHYESVLEAGENISRGLEAQTLYALAQLYFLEEQYQQSLDYMRRWMNLEDSPGPDAYIFLGQLHFQLQDYSSAIQQIERGIEIARSRDREIRENWWQLLRYLYWEQENYTRVLEILEILVRDFPSREYWLQLAALYGQEGDEQRQTRTMEAAHVGGFFERESDYLSYAGVLMQRQVPYRAARSLQEGVERGIVEENASNLRMLGQAWQMAQEVDRAIPVLQRAARASDDGEIYARLAALFLEREDNADCIDAADRALERGDLRDPPQTYMVKAICQFNADSLSEARGTFNQCSREARRAGDERTERSCRQWVTFIDSEVQRRERLQASL
jgi:TolA-binding protein